MQSETNIAERLKAELLDDLQLMTPADLQAYWRQTKWPKPNLAELGRNQWAVPHKRHGERVEIFAPLRYALNRLDPELVAAASDELDPFGWLLEIVNIIEWSKFCRARRVPWMARVWLAAASQLRAELKLIFKAHGWSDTWEKLRRNQRELRAAEDFFSAQLSHARGQRRTELLRIRVIGLSEASRRRFRRAKKGAGRRAGVSGAEKYMVQHWLELPQGFPGLCFFSDVGLHSLFEILGLSTGEGEATKQIRERLGLIQAGAKRHLVEEVIDLGSKLRFTGSMIKEPWVFMGSICWGKRRLWPQ